MWMLAAALVVSTPASGPEGCERFSVQESASASAEVGCVDEGDEITLRRGGYAVLLDAQENKEHVCIHLGKKPVKLVVDDEGVTPKAGCRSKKCKKALKKLKCHENEVVLAPAEPTEVDDDVSGASNSDGTDGDQAGTTPGEAGSGLRIQSADSGTQVLLTDLTAVDVPDATAAIITSLSAVELAEQKGIDVVSGRELDALVKQAAQSSAEGCREDAASCMAEVAGALGARYIVSGRVARAGRLLLVNMTLFDTDEARAAARVQFEARDVVAASKVLPQALRNLLAPLIGEEVVELPPPPHVRAPEDADAVWGAVLAGVCAGVSGACCYLVPGLACGGAMAACCAGTGNPTSTLILTPAFSLGSFCAPCACAGGGAGAALGDMVFGYEFSWLKVAAAALVTGVGMFLTGLTAPTIGFIGAILIIGIGGQLIGVLNDASGETPTEIVATLGAVMALAAIGSLVTGLVAGVLFNLGVVLLEASPDPLDVPELEEGELPPELDEDALRFRRRRPAVAQRY